MQAACSGGAARQDDEVPHVVPRAALAGARLSARRLVTRLGSVVALALLAGAALAQSDQAALDRLVAAYPDALAGHDSKTLRWRDGTAMPLSGDDKDKTFAQMLRHASIPINYASPTRVARFKSRRRSMPIRAGFATPPTSPRCTATAGRTTSCRTSS